MIKTFFKNSLIYTIGTILNRGIGIILIPIYTRYLSPSEYGVIDLFMILASIISLTIALEIHQAVVRYYQDTTDEIQKMQYVSSAFIFSIFVYSSYFMISYIFSDTFTMLLLDDAKYENVFLLASGAIATSGLFYFTSGQLRWQILPKESVIVSVVHLLVVAFIAVYLLAIQGMKVESIFIGQIFGNIFGIVFSIYYSKKSYKLVFIFEKLKKMVSFSYPLVFSGVSIFITLYIDRIAIKELLGLKELGIYGIAYRFAGVASLVMIGFQSSLTPLIYKHYKEDHTPKNIAKLFDGFVILAFFVISGSILFSKEVIVLMSTSEYYTAAGIIPPLVMAVFFSNMYIFSPGMSIANKTKMIATISLVGAIINTMLNYTMIPIFGLIGASFATLISAVFVFYIHVVLSNKYYNIHYGFIKKILIFLFILGMSYLTNSLYTDISISSVVIKFTLLCTISVISIYLLVESNDFKKIRKLF